MPPNRRFTMNIIYGVAAANAFVGSVASNFLSNVTDRWLVFAILFIVLFGVVVGSDWLVRYAEKKEAEANKQALQQQQDNARRKQLRRQTVEHDERVYEVLRHQLRKTNVSWTQLVQTEALEYVVYRRHDKTLSPVCDFQAPTKFTIALPFGQVWSKQAVQQNKAVATTVDETMLRLFKHPTHREAFANVQTALVAPIYRPDSDHLPDDTVGMLMVYSAQPQVISLLGVQEIVEDTTELNKHLAMILSYDYMCGD